MAIDVVCPNGHQIKVKDKYAGKKGLCPRCRAAMHVPELPAEDEEGLIDLVPRRDLDEELNRPLPKASGSGHIDDDEEGEAPAGAGAQSAGESLLSSSVIRHQKMCPKCYNMAPIWFARCLNCDHFFRD